ncbi:hypothetical protein SAMN04488034_104220 [Salinimicrobium catena]|uniref:DUF5723 domain-containing protein n=1 Tax=Salinimicrobium catena TaxID=390640 RepID=A0A1H5NKU0_9FLAO|nr:DUF5723 family protein [Salinimicrobium catena]SDL47639.1 hypothetical protein SAMN04488140_104220 [Salinimicrobium catena]SEF01427.1 hypothetical protein SAMN04488034_104220 [Salinimicrobium catena]
MRLFFVLLVWFTGQLVYAQNKQLLYNVNSLPQNLMANPGGEVRFDMHAGVPFFSQISFSAGSSGVSLYDIFGEGNGTVNENIDRSLSRISDRDFFTVRNQLELLFLGWRDKKRNYFSAGIYQESDVFAYFPKDLAVLAWEGNENQKNFHLSDLAFTGEVLNVFHFGVSHYWNRDLSIGIRGKLYSGIINVRSIDNNGDFFTYGSSENGVSRPNLRKVDVLLRTAGLGPFLNENKMTNKELFNHFRSQAFLGGNLGVGVDIGFTYFLTDQYRLTGSLLDIGMLKHTEDVRTFRYYGDYDSNQESTLDPDHPDSGELGEYFHEEELSDPYISTRPVKLNASFDYGFEEDLYLAACDYRERRPRRRYRNHVGLQLFSMKRPRGLVNAATVYFDRKFSQNFFGKVTYTVDSFSYSNVGLLVSGRFSNFNLYLAADNLLDYSNLAKARNASVQLGFQFIFDKG